LETTSEHTGGINYLKMKVFIKNLNNDAIEKLRDKFEVI